MARVNPIEGRAGGLLLRIANWCARRMFGRELLPFKVLAHNPRFLLPFAGMAAFTWGRARLSHEIRALAMQLVATLNGCAWCIDFGRADAERRGVSVEKLAAVGRHAESPLFSPAERAALAYAEAATQLGARVPDPVFAELRRHFSEREIVELTVAVAAENFFNRIYAPLELEEQGFCATR